jgi:hypothetical protein
MYSPRGKCYILAFGEQGVGEGTWMVAKGGGT